MWGLLRSVPRLIPKSFVRSAAVGKAQNVPVDPFSRDTTELDYVTSLENGLRVATEALPGHFSALGVYVNAGSRYESKRLEGLSHIVDRLAFKSTRWRTADNMLESLESLGGNHMCSSSREFLVYQSAVFNNDVEKMMALLSETIRDPLITAEEVKMQQDTALYEIQEIWSKPDLILPEILHAAAYNDKTLGKPTLCSKERVLEITPKLVNEYRDVFITPSRLVLAFAGIPHEKALELARKYFGDMQASSTPSSEETTLKTSQDSLETPSNIENLAPLSMPSQFTGGSRMLPRGSIKNNDEFTHFYLAFESLPLTDPDIYALAALQMLLGGGGSFSAGGPGKGMYSRLFTDVLNQYGWVESCLVFQHSYIDSGLFGISASCRHDAAHRIADVVCRQLALIIHNGRGGLTDSEVERSKNQLRSSLLMNLESRMTELEDLGRQVQVQGYKIGSHEMCQKISALTTSDLRRVAERVLTGAVCNAGQGSGKPAYVAQGEIDAVGDVEAICRKYGLGIYR